MTKERIVKSRTLAAMLSVSDRRVRQLVDEGVVIKGKRKGEYKLLESTQRYIAYLKAGGQRKEISEKKEAEQLKYLMEKTREKKRENDIEEKKVASVDLLTLALEKAANQIVPILESLPLIMKRNWPEITGDQITLAKKAIAECRNAIADMEIDIEN